MTKAVPILETRRLLLRPLELADADAVQALFPRWEIVRFLNDRIPWPYPADGALTFIRDLALPAVAAGEAWHWSIRPKSEPGRLIGCINLSLGAEDNRGFWLDPAWQGQGLMTEAADVVTDFWFGELGQETLRIPKALANEASRRISVSSGMRVIASGESDYVGGRLPSETWELTREEWLARKR
jgi:ribosomal-protein-alanine N-acetyltransferase